LFIPRGRYDPRDETKHPSSTNRRRIRSTVRSLASSAEATSGSARAKVPSGSSVGLEKDPGVGEFACVALALEGYVSEFDPFLCRQCHAILVSHEFLSALYRMFINE
jgi:hypothetical protein